MARSIGDLELELDVLAGPDRWNAPAWRLELPPARATTLGRPPDRRLARRHRTARSTPRPAGCSPRRSAAIESAGGRVDTEARPGFTLEKVDTVFKRLLFAALSPASTRREKIEHMAANTDDTPLGFVQAGDGDAPPRLARRTTSAGMQIRETVAAVLRALRRDPAAGPAARRDPPRPLRRRSVDRTVEIDGVDAPVPRPVQLDRSRPAPACCPATVVPVGIGRRRAADRRPDRRALPPRPHHAASRPPDRPPAGRLPASGAGAANRAPETLAGRRACGASSSGLPPITTAAKSVAPAAATAARPSVTSCSLPIKRDAVDAVHALDVEHRPVRRQRGVVWRGSAPTNSRAGLGIVGHPHRQAAHDRRARAPGGARRRR